MNTKWIASTLTVVMLVGLVGCGRGNPGGPGASTTSTTERTSQDDRGQTTTTESRTTATESDRTFTLGPPILATRMKQGETRQVAISINRGRNFDENVDLTFENVPNGVTIAPSKMAVARSEKEAKINVTATDNAPVGTFNIRVVGHPQSGADASNEFKITIDQK